MRSDQNRDRDPYPERMRLTPQADHYSAGEPATLPAAKKKKKKIKRKEINKS
jgi:hypothetical protein